MGSMHRLAQDFVIGPGVTVRARYWFPTERDGDIVGENAGPVHAVAAPSTTWVTSGEVLTSGEGFFGDETGTHYTVDVRQVPGAEFAAGTFDLWVERLRG